MYIKFKIKMIPSVQWLPYSQIRQCVFKSPQAFG